MSARSMVGRIQIKRIKASSFDEVERMTNTFLTSLHDAGCDVMSVTIDQSQNESGGLGQPVGVQHRKQAWVVYRESNETLHP